MFNQTDMFDVLVVYSHKIAASASSTRTNSNSPFAVTSRRSNYNNAYAYFLETCAQNNIKTALTTSADIIGAGLCETYWVYADNCWTKKQNQCFSKVIFDKFSPVNDLLKKSRRLLFSSLEITPFNDTYLFSLFFDKLKSFKKFPVSSIPTVAVNSSDINSIKLAISQLKTLITLHGQKSDFSKGIILKDRHGCGGYSIYKIDSDIAQSIGRILSKNIKTSFIIQPFTLFDRGYQYKNLSGSIDIRLIFMGKKIVQTYIRTAKINDFRCNEHQGGTLTYISKNQVPGKVIKCAQAIADILNKPNSLYALDFIVSNHGNVYFLEGNCGPGLDWNLKLSQNEKMSKKLIRTVVKELKSRVKTTQSQLIASKEIPTLPLPDLSLPVFVSN